MPETPETEPAPKPEPRPETEPAPKDPGGPATSPADPGLPPETANTSQDDAPDQAQTFADQSLGRAPLADAGDTRRAPASGTDIADDGGSVPDVVDHMNQMATSGRIDMSAYRGERNDDDVERALGPDGEEEYAPRGIE
jgi:hypothetical protein